MRSLLLSIGCVLVLGGCGRIGYDPINKNVPEDSLIDGGVVEGAGFDGGNDAGTTIVETQSILSTCVSNISGVAQIGAGQSHACLLLETGGVKCWGSQGYQGDGTNTPRATPTDVIGLTVGVKSLTVRKHNACALTEGDGVRCWGETNSSLGSGAVPSTTYVPVEVVGLNSGVRMVRQGTEHVCAVLHSGSVKCWGENGLGQLGDGTTIERYGPVDVVGLGSGVVAVDAGQEHSCAVLDSGGVRCWGGNADGQLGDGTTTSRLTPVDVVGLASRAVDVGTGMGHSCALLDTGGVQCWGGNLDRQLGDGTGTARLTPVHVVGLSSGVAALSVGVEHTCVRLEGGGAKCWGYPNTGQLGERTDDQPAVPVDVERLGGPIRHIAAGNDMTCVVLESGEAQCWGNNNDGQLGDGNGGNTRERPRPVPVYGLASGVASVGAGGDFTCVILDTGQRQCWGDNFLGQLGNGDLSGGPYRRLSLAADSGLSAGARMIVGGISHTCALLETGGVECWGSNSFGELGDGSNLARATPGLVSGLSSGVVDLSAGAYHVCATTETGGIKCWGKNSFGELGDGSITGRNVPVDVVGLASAAVAVSAGYSFSCALLDTGAVQCWGSNLDYQLGDGTTVRGVSPVTVAGLGAGARSLAAGHDHACVVLNTGGVRCWGRNSSGQAGSGDVSNLPSPRLVSLPFDVPGLASDAVQITAGESHSCALLDTGAVQCWGRNGVGQLGNTNQDEDSPVPFTAPQLSEGVLSVRAGSNHTCAVLGDGGVKCWGWDYYGQASGIFEGTPRAVCLVP